MKLFTKLSTLTLSVLLLGGLGLSLNQNVVESKATNPLSGWVKITSIDEIVNNGTYILGYEATPDSYTIVPMRNEGTATTSAAGYLYSGTTSGSSNNGTIDMSSTSSLSDTSAYEVKITASSKVTGAYNIMIGDNYLGNTNSKNNCKLFSSEATTTAFTPTVADGVFTMKIVGNATYFNLSYNSSSPRFAVYGSTQKNLTIFKKYVATTASDLTNYVLGSDTANQCQTKFALAKDSFLAISSSEQTLFKTTQEGETETMTNARKRYEAWATYLGQKPYATGSALGNLDINNESNIQIIAITTIGVISLACLGAFLFHSKKRIIEK